MDFAHALREQLEADPKLSRRGERILALIKSRPSRRRARKLEKLEAHSRVHLGIGDKEKVSWGKIDWQTILKTLLPLLLKLLPMLGA